MNVVNDCSIVRDVLCGERKMLVQRYSLNSEM